MELSLLHHPLKPTFFHHSLSSLSTTGRRHSYRSAVLLECRCSLPSLEGSVQNLCLRDEGRRAVVGCLLAAAVGISFCEAANAVSTSRRALRGAKIPESEFTTLPNGLKYYDLKVGGGLKAVKGSRVAKNYYYFDKASVLVVERYDPMLPYILPYGFDVGQSERGAVLKGLDLGVEGMRVGGQRLLIVPPELAYGTKGVQEIPPNATIEMDVELISIKQSPFGSAVKIIEG